MIKCQLISCYNKAISFSNKLKFSIVKKNVENFT